MGVLMKDEFEKQDRGPGKVDETECFLCGGKLFDHEYATGGIVYWAGFGKMIALHQGCAEHLGVHLIQDARSCVRMTGVRSQLIHLSPKQAENLWFVKR